MKKTNLLLFILFLSLCSAPSNEGVTSLSGDTTTTSIIEEEDYPVVLTQCLNEEMGYNIATPFDIEDLKTTISQLSNSKEEEKQLREKGLNVPDPSQQEPKVDLSGLKESRDDIMPLLQECGWQK